MRPPLRWIGLALATLGAVPWAVAQAPRTSVYLELGDAGPFYVVGAERQIGRSPDTFVRAGLTVLTAFVADGGVIATTPVSVGRTVRPWGGRFGVEGTVGAYGVYAITGTRLSGPPDRGGHVALAVGAAARWDPRRGRLGARYGAQLHLGPRGLSRPLLGLALTVRVGGRSENAAPE